MGWAIEHEIEGRWQVLQWTVRKTKKEVAHVLITLRKAVTGEKPYQLPRGELSRRTRIIRVKAVPM